MTATAPRSPAGSEPPRELIERFARALARLWPEGGQLGLAVSGGPDSLAMLLLAEAAIPRRFEVATVDHGLRPESAAECATVRELCAAKRIPCAVLRVLVQGGNVQAEARGARYAALGQWAADRGLSAVATAHHADDQAETVLMRLNRGSGVAGLAGIRERGTVPGTDLPLLRPLLGFRRAELAEVVAAAGLAAAQDPGNADERFDRVRLRNILAGSDWLGVIALATSAANLADADEALEWAARREWDERVRRGRRDGALSPARAPCRGAAGGRAGDRGLGRRTARCRPGPPARPARSGRGRQRRARPGHRRSRRMGIPPRTAARGPARPQASCRPRPCGPRVMITLSPFLAMANSRATKSSGAPMQPWLA